MSFFYRLIKLTLIFTLIDYITSYFLFLFFIRFQLISFVFVCIILLTLLYMKICYHKGYVHIWFLPLSHVVMYIASQIPFKYDFNISMVLWQITSWKVIPSIVASIIYIIIINTKKHVK